MDFFKGDLCSSSGQYKFPATIYSNSSILQRDHAKAILRCLRFFPPLRQKICQLGELLREKQSVFTSARIKDEFMSSILVFRIYESMRKVPLHPAFREYKAVPFGLPFTVGIFGTANFWLYWDMH